MSHHPIQQFQRNCLITDKSNLAMTKLMDTRCPGFEEDFCKLLSARHVINSELNDRVAAIIQDVKTRGDEALFEFTQEFDGCTIDEESIYIGSDEIVAAEKLVSSECREAIELAAQRIADYHRHQLPNDHELKTEDTSLGWRWTPIDSVGIYVPGGSASYPSSVLMNAVPANVAGVKKITMTVPTPNGVVSPLVLFAAHCAGVTSILRIGGAQAIAALAYGTQTVRPVDKITGPGNAYVTMAKRQVFGDVGIDLVAGPSEVVVIADETANPQWVASDLLAQAEHDASAQSILLTTSGPFASSVLEKIGEQLSALPRHDIATKSWKNHGALIVAQSVDEIISLTNRMAPEHLQICVEHPEPLVSGIVHAGAIFIGMWTPEAIGDYIAGPNHVLPTTGTARFSSGLSVPDFMKRTTITKMTPTSFAKIARSAEILAISEGLDAHARSLRVRLNALGEINHDQ